MAAYLQVADLRGATTQYASPFGTVGVDFSQYSTHQLVNLIARASNKIDSYCRQTFALTNTQERYKGNGTNELRLRKFPLAQLPDSVIFGIATTTGSLVCDTTTTAALAGNPAPFAGLWSSGGTPATPGAQSGCVLTNAAANSNPPLVGQALTVDAGPNVETVILTSVSGGGPYTVAFATALAHTLPVPAATVSQVPVADISNMLVGQFLQWADGVGELGISITAIAPAVAGATSGPGTLTLRSQLLAGHAAGARAVVNTVDFLNIVMPTQVYVPIPSLQLMVNRDQGTITNYTPLMFQQLGYATIFPKNLPLLIRYTYGFPAGQIPNALQDVCLELCLRIALRMAHPMTSGVLSAGSDTERVQFAPFMPAEMDADLAELLIPYRRGIGLH